MTNHWQQFFNTIKKEDYTTLLRNYEQFEKDGYIGECPLRNVARLWTLTIPGNGTTNIPRVMRDIAFDIYRYYTKLYLNEGKNGGE